MNKLKILQIEIWFICILISSCASNKNIIEEGVQTTPLASISLPDSLIDYKFYLNHIDENDLKKHLAIYASDSFQGRKIGGVGEELAIDYIKTYYDSLGLKPFTQEFSVVENSFPQWNAKIGKSYLKSKNFYTFFHFNSFQNTSEAIVYANYGLETEKYSDYTELDVTDKVVLVRYGEPKNAAGKYVFSDSTAQSKYSENIESLKFKIEAAKNKGAKALLIYDDLGGKEVKLDKKSYTSLKELHQVIRFNIGSYTRPRLNSFVDIDIPVFFVDKAFLDRFKIGNLGSRKTGELKTESLAIEYTNERSLIESKNVFSFIEGTEKSEEIVVLSAHLDHIGTNGDKIYNGADDDGSGTVALFEIAQAFIEAKKNGHGPKRSILLAHFNGEEIGLLGSEYYTNNPIYALDKTVANLNIDMIGRTDLNNVGEDKKNYVYVIGPKISSKEILWINETVNKDLGELKLDYSFDSRTDRNQFFYRSDHYNFAKNNIPVIFYFNGTHIDYHRETDTVDKISFDLLKKRSDLIFSTAWVLANRAKRVKIN